MKIASLLATTAVAATLALGGTAPAHADRGFGDGGTNSHYPPVSITSGDVGFGDGGTDSQYPPVNFHPVVIPRDIQFPLIKEKDKARGKIAEVGQLLDEAGNASVWVRIEKIHAYKVTVKTYNCEGKIVDKKSHHVGTPAYPFAWSTDYEADLAEDASELRIKFSQPGKVATQSIAPVRMCDS